MPNYTKDTTKKFKLCHLWKKVYISFSCVFTGFSLYLPVYVGIYVHIAAHMCYNVPSSLIEPILCYIQSVFICTIDSCFFMEKFVCFQQSCQFWHFYHMSDKLCDNFRHTQRRRLFFPPELIALIFKAYCCIIKQVPVFSPVCFEPKIKTYSWKAI